jgi:glycosyltransferase involved in cell wall biosynthesis
MKRKHSVGYFSAYYRGLECLLDMWPKIRKAIPDATLDVFYGWESWVGLEGEDDFYLRMEQKFKEYASQGVTVHGRVSHEELAKAMQEIQVWAYPTEFTEIHCITALKAVEAGCIPVVTDVGALNETVVGHKVSVPLNDIYTNKKAQERFAQTVIAALKSPEKFKIEKVENRYWTDVASQWDKNIKELLCKKK